MDWREWGIITFSQNFLFKIGPASALISYSEFLLCFSFWKLIIPLVMAMNLQIKLFTDCRVFHFWHYATVLELG
jgi:hypothetical protein